jgi:hypothetical protein
MEIGYGNRATLDTGRSEADLSAVIMAEIPQKAGMLEI